MSSSMPSQSPVSTPLSWRAYSATPNHGGVPLSGASASARLTWRDLCVSVSNSSDENCKILHNISGYGEPGIITALMGPSGSGKSTLLDTLAGRLPSNVSSSGEILVNGRRQQLSFGAAGYVTQEETLLGTLTVRETITYAANLQLPSAMSKEKKMEAVERTILEMGLKDCADTVIGNWHLRGVSRGEKRRVGIAIEIITRPLLLFLDEPTSGLDSSAAFFVVSTLKNLARGGRTLIVAIHQPSAEVFELFDNLCLLSQGKTIYFGEASAAKDFFASAGFPCPPYRNPSDHYLRAINADFDAAEEALKMAQDIEAQNDPNFRATISLKDLGDPLATVSKKQVARVLAERYSSSEYWLGTAARIEEINQKKGQVLVASGRHTNFLVQAATLTERSFKNKSRDLGYYWLRMFVYALLATALGSLYFRIGNSYESIQSRASCIFYLAGLLTFMSIGGFPSFAEDMKVFTRERLNGHYGILAFIVAHTLSAMPFVLLCSIVPSIISYNMVKMHHGFSHCAYLIIMVFGAIACVEGITMIVSTLVPSFLMGLIVSAGIQGFFLLSCGFFRAINSLPKAFWKYPMSYVAFQRYALQGLYKNEFVGLEFKNKLSILPNISGSYFLREYGVELTRSKWWDFAILILMTFLYNTIFCIIIKFTDNWPWLHSRLFRRKSLQLNAIKVTNTNDTRQ